MISRICTQKKTCYPLEKLINCIKINTKMSMN